MPTLKELYLYTSCMCACGVVALLVLVTIGSLQVAPEHGVRCECGRAKLSEWYLLSSPAMAQAAGALSLMLSHLQSVLVQLLPAPDAGSEACWSRSCCHKLIQQAGEDLALAVIATARWDCLIKIKIKIK